MLSFTVQTVNARKVGEVGITKLKPCPFCGGKAKLEKMGYPHHVYCTECHARVIGKGFDADGEQDAIKRWNTRTEGR